MSPRSALPDGLTLNAEQRVVFEEMSRREQATFNGLGDNPSRLAYLQALIDVKRSRREKSEIELQAIYFAVYIAVLICLTVLKTTIYKDDEKILDLFSIVLNIILFAVEATVMLWKCNLHWFYVISIILCIIFRVLLAILLWKYINLSATITIHNVEAGIIFSRVFMK